MQNKDNKQYEGVYSQMNDLNAILDDIKSCSVSLYCNCEQDDVPTEAIVKELEDTMNSLEKFVDLLK